MPSITNVGGSLTSALALTLIAWGVRAIRTRALQRQQEKVVSAKRQAPGRFFAPLSPTAVRMLVETDPTLHLLVDVRSKSSIESRPLPQELQSALRIEVDEVEEVLSDKDVWCERFPEVAFPHRDTVFVFISEGEDQGLDAAAGAAAKGFQRTATLEGGLEKFTRHANAAKPELRYINRDAAALCLGAVEGVGKLPSVTFVDLRRYDERTLFGSIQGAVHLPVDKWSSALRLSPEEFEEMYHFKKPPEDYVLILQCRTNRRSSWAAAIAHEEGIKNCLVYRQGSYGWRLDHLVKPYGSYEVTDPPPDAEEYSLETVDIAAAEQELRNLGLL